MSQPPLCASCGNALPEDAPQGLCARCLLEAALPGSSTLGGQEAFSGESGSSPPGPPETLVSFTEQDDPGSWLEGEVVPTIPGYAIGKTLGRGGMGVVYRATQRSLNRPVALKMIRADLGVESGQLARFRIEAEAMGQLRHPNVVQIYDVGEAVGAPYFSLELLDGGSLADRLDGGPMPPRDAAALTATLARALGAVHRVGIIHRDLKPPNVLFDADGTPKITDFGLARRLEVEKGQTMSGQVMGTPSYMAPEQARGETSRIGPPADIYALGAILYETLTGRPPFRGPSTMETLAQVIFGEPVPPSRLQPKLPRDLETICLKCLHKEPERRYATADDLAADLGRFLAGAPILARPTPAWERAAKWARRRPAAAALVAVGALLALGLAVAAERYGAYRRGEDGRMAQLQLEALNDLNLGLGQRASGALDRASTTLTALQAKLRGEPRMAALFRWSTAELNEVNRLRARAASDAADRDRLVHFGKLFDRALLLDSHAVIFPESLVSAGEQAVAADAHSRRSAEPPVAKIRATAAAALEVFPLGPVATPLPLPAVLTDEQRVAVEADRYLLLLVGRQS
jgi:hypothetical protein